MQAKKLEMMCSICRTYLCYTKYLYMKTKRYIGENAEFKKTYLVEPRHMQIRQCKTEVLFALNVDCQEQSKLDFP